MADIQPAIPLKGLEVWACEWEDAHWNSDEFESDRIIHRPVNYVSVGILLKDDARGMSLSTDICEVGTFRGINFVPAKMIIRRWKIGTLPPANPRNHKKSKKEKALDLTQTTLDRQSSELS